MLDARNVPVEQGKRVAAWKIRMCPVWNGYASPSHIPNLDPADRAPPHFANNMSLADLSWACYHFRRSRVKDLML